MARQGRIDPRIKEALPAVERRRRQEREIRERADRARDRLWREIDAELDAEEAAAGERAREAALEAAKSGQPLTDTDYKRKKGREELRAKEDQERGQLAEKGIYPRLPAYAGIRAQMKAGRRAERRQERHKAAEVKANIPARKAKWEAEKDKIASDHREELAANSRRHAEADAAAAERQSERLAKLGPYPELPQPEELPTPPSGSVFEPSQSTAALVEAMRSLDALGVGGAEPPEPTGKTSRLARLRR
jgi:hypothetical protein